MTTTVKDDILAAFSDGVSIAAISAITGESTENICYILYHEIILLRSKIKFLQLKGLYK